MDIVLQNKKQKLSKALLFLFILVAGITAWHYRVIQDDAFISFTYAKHLVNGQGLTWNGLPIEGYTNFLWVLLMAIPESLQINTVFFSQIAGIIFYLLTLLVTAQISYYLFNNAYKTLVTIFLFCTNYSVVSYATGGLETSLQI